MKKLTLQFQSLKELSDFARKLNCGYITNTVNNTLTLSNNDLQEKTDLDHYNARIVEITDKVFSYEMQIL